MQHNHQIAHHNVQLDWVPDDNAITAEGNTERFAEGNGDTQAPDTDGAAGNIVGLYCHCNQRWFGDGCAEANAEGEQIYPAVVLPVNTSGRHRRIPGIAKVLDDGGVGKLCCHQPAQRKQGQIETD